MYRVLPPGKVYFCFTFNDDSKLIPNSIPSVSTEYGTWHHMDNLTDEIGTLPDCGHKIYKTLAIKLDTALQREEPKCPLCKTAFQLRKVEFEHLSFTHTNVIEVKKRVIPLLNIHQKPRVENNKEVEIGSYPFFRAGKLGVSIVLRSTDQKKIDQCNDQILKFVKTKNIEILREV